MAEEKKLYQKKGFEVVKEEAYPYLRWLLGFGGSTTMQREVMVGQDGESEP